MKNFIKWFDAHPISFPAQNWDRKDVLMRGDPKRWLKWWARTERGQDNLSDLIDLGYELEMPPPISGGSRNFDGSNDTINRSGDDATLDVVDADSLILQALAKVDSGGTVLRMIAGKKSEVGDNWAAGYQLATTFTGNAYFSVCSGGGVFIAMNGAAMTAGTWYALTGVLSAVAAADDNAYLFQDTTQTGPTNSTGLGSLANALAFRAGSSPAGNFFDGDIAYVRFWKKTGAVWTTQEINERVEIRNRLYIPQDATMQLQWILWDTGSPTTANDYTDNSLDGTYTETTFVEDPHQIMKASESPIKVQATPAVAGQPMIIRNWGIPTGSTRRAYGGSAWN